MTEYTTLLPQRRLLEISGNDRFTFLQGLITADIKLLEDQETIWSAILTPQGRLKATFFLTQSPDKRVLWLDCDQHHQEFLLKFLNLYKLRAQVQITQTHYKIGALWGDKSHQNNPKNLIIYKDPRLIQAGWRFLTEDVSSIPLCEQTYCKHRLKYDLPDGYKDVNGYKSYPAELNMDILGGISWDKGCYMGQEVTARLHYRRRLKKRIIPIQTSKNINEIDHTLYDRQGRKCGTIRSFEGKSALAMINIANLHDKIFLSDQSIITYHIPLWLKATLPDQE